MGKDAKLKHRLAAIMATDVVGYSQSMQSDEAGTLTAVSTIRETTENQIRQHRGRIANTAGDSILAEFTSAVDAVSCAMALQEALHRHVLQIRIGIHTGDVVDKDGMQGTAINIAARLEGISPPGGIVISAAVRDDVVGKLPASFTDLGMKTLKNIEQPVRAYSLSAASGSCPVGRRGDALPLPDEPSIAVLPFENLSGDREQDYFADGMVEEIITALSRMLWFFVIARSSSFAYKGRALDVKQVGRELGVRYVLEGSVRKAGSRVRIAGQLIDTSTGAHLWADCFQGALKDIFDLQDQMTEQVVGAIVPKLEQAEIKRAKRKPTESLDAYDHYLRGLAAFHEWTKDANAKAKDSFFKAIELDPHSASAYAMAARCYAQSKVSGWVIDPMKDVADADRLARRAVELAESDAVPLCFAGWALALVVEDFKDGPGLIKKALSLNPDFAPGWLCSGWVRICLGEHELAIKQVTRARRLSPLGPLYNHTNGAIATAHFLMGHYEEASSWAGRALLVEPNYPSGLRVAAASNALLGRIEETRKAIGRLQQQADPNLRLSNLRDRLPLQPEDFARWEEALRRAGLPE